MKQDIPLETEEMRDGFAERATKIRTRIWNEQATDENPYITGSVRCHGYDLKDLVTGRNFVDVFSLLFLGELPSAPQAQLLEQLMIALINPGPRDPGTRAAVITTATKTMHGNTLPIGLATFAGSKHGAGEARMAMRFIQKNLREPIKVVAKLPQTPGFGNTYNGRDVMAGELLELLSENEAAGDAMRWAAELDMTLANIDKGVLPAGVAAACLLDLGFAESQGTALYQLIAAPGIAAHALEYMNAGPNDIPFPDDEHMIYAE